MTEDIWKHLPYAIYLDTNILRRAGTRLEKAWINELLSITTQFGISLCISELVLAEWCEHLGRELKSNRDDLLNSLDVLKHYDISMPTIRPHDIKLPEKKELADMVRAKLSAIGISVIPNWTAPLEQLLDEAVTKRAPFEAGGKGLCDAVILESYVQHAKDNFKEPRVLMVSRDAAVNRSGGRFGDHGVIVDLVNEENIVERLTLLLDDELAARIERKKEKLRKYIIAYEAEILKYVRSSPLKLTDGMLLSFFDRMIGGEFSFGETIESVLSIRPTRITNVIGGAPPYGEEPSEERYPVQISVELELDVVVSTYGGSGLSIFGKTRATVQPDTLDASSPVPLEKVGFDSKRTESIKTISRPLTVLATLDAKKEKEGILADFKIERIL